MKKNVRILLLGLTVLMTGSLSAQSNNEGKIKIEITKEINGEKKTFKGEYNSPEEMHADPGYREFAGEENDFNFWFDGSSSEDMIFHLDQMSDHTKSFFKFFDNEDEEGNNSFFFKHFDDDSEGFFDVHLDGMDLEAYKEKMKEIGVDMEELVDHFHHEDADGHVRVIEIKRVKIVDVAEEFGKKGKVDERSKLVLDDLSFYPNPSSNGRFKVRFRVPGEEELNIKVFNLEGKEVFNRYFESFSGTYSETIDLSRQKEGIYLLEISQGKKRLTKKIVIN